MAEDQQVGLARRAHLARARSRVVVAGVFGLVVFAALMTLSPWQFAVLGGWDTTAALFLTWALTVTWARDANETAALASREDDSHAAADLLLLSASIVSLVGVALTLVKAGDEKGGARALTIALAVGTVVLSWATVQTVFMLRYARLFYADHGGINFNERSDPDYRDFAYVAATIGMAYQVSDTDLTSKVMRRTATHHALLSYLFGTFIVAMMINFVAGLAD